MQINAICFFRIHFILQKGRDEIILFLLTYFVKYFITFPVQMMIYCSSSDDDVFFVAFRASVDGSNKTFSCSSFQHSFYSLS